MNRISSSTVKLAQCPATSKFLIIRCCDMRSVMQNDVQQRAVDFDVTVVINQAQL
jgi:hypothetical protein